jgi:hypothetical protein
MARPTRFDVRDHRTWDAYMHGDHLYPDLRDMGPGYWGLAVSAVALILFIAALLSLWLP